MQSRTHHLRSAYDAESGIRTRAILVGGECSHHCAIPEPLVDLNDRNAAEGKGNVQVYLQ